MKGRIRIIRGHQFLEVPEDFAQQGKYREDRVHWERHDGRVWALIADLQRLSTGNRGKS